MCSAEVKVSGHEAALKAAAEKKTRPIPELVASPSPVAGIIAATAPLAVASPIARWRGEPVLELPHDLYIPPDALQVFLEAFEGPLDLLLYLIRRQGLEVLDIPMAELTRQYMDYIELMRANQLELAAEYLLMAAVLIEIKSRMLLPRPAESIAGEADPRAELVRRLLEYEQMKLAAQRLDALPCAGRDYALVVVEVERSTAQNLATVTAADLRDAWSFAAIREARHRHHKISRELLSVRAQMARILRRLRAGEFVEFAELCRSENGAAELVVCFLAALELARETLIEVSQRALFSPIYLKLTDAESTAERSNAA